MSLKLLYCAKLYTGVPFLGSVAAITIILSDAELVIHGSGFGSELAFECLLRAKGLKEVFQ
jgi:hypothetical protein